MTGIGTLGVIALFVIVIALLVWLMMIVRADRHPRRSKKPGGRLKRGPVSGGAIHGEPGQTTLTGEAPRYDEHSKDEPTKNGPLDL